jgi:hypothetical protein
MGDYMKNDKNCALKLGAAIFGVVAFVHALRLVQGWGVTVAGSPVPMSVSGAGFVVLVGLSYWYWKLAK